MSDELDDLIARTVAGGPARNPPKPEAGGISVAKKVDDHIYEPGADRRCRTCGRHIRLHARKRSYSPKRRLSR